MYTEIPNGFELVSNPPPATDPAPTHGPMDRGAAMSVVQHLEESQGVQFSAAQRLKMIDELTQGRVMDGQIPHSAPAAHSADGAEIPEGFQLLGPGVGRPGNSTQDDAFARDLRQTGMDARTDPFIDTGPSQFGRGVAHGVKSSVLGVAQLGEHISPLFRANDALSQYVTGQSPIADLDNTINADMQNWQRDSASQSTSGKVGDLFGGYAATAPLAGMAIPAKGAGLLSALSRGAVGGGLLAATQPTYGPNFAEQKLEQVGTGAMFGAGIPAGARGAAWLAERTYGPNVLAQIANYSNTRANQKPFAQEGERLAERTRIPLTPGQVSGSRIQTGLENMSRQSLFSADRAFEADQRIAQKAVDYIDRTMDKLTVNPASEAAVGFEIQNATRGAITKIADRREAVAAQQYGAIDKALGGRKFVQPTNAMRQADAIISEFSHVPSPEAARIVAQAQALKKQFEASGGYTFSQAQFARSYYGRAARGSANVFDQVSPPLAKKLATRIFGAMTDDIEASAAHMESNNLGPGLVPSNYFKGQAASPQGIVGAIREANANYRRYSQMIEATKAHPIARLFGDHINVDDVMVFDKIPPETVINRLGQMKPTELRMVRDFMEQSAPEAWQQYKRLLVEKALNEARTMPTSAGANFAPFNAAGFVRALGGNKPDQIKRLQTIFSADEFSQIDDAFKAASRMGDQFGRNTSGTGPYMEVRGMFDSLRQGAFKAAATTGGHALGLQKVANVMFNADGRRAVIELSKVPPNSLRAASLAGFLSALASGKRVSYPGDDARQAYTKGQR